MYEEKGGSYPNEETARRHAAIHRQLSGASSAAMDALKAKADITALDEVQTAALGAVADLEAKWTTSHVERSTSGRLVFAQGTGTVPVTRTSTGRLVVRA
ncbi:MULTISPECIES: hypothetical protein [Actinomycetes]